MQQLLVISDETSFVHRLNHRLARYDMEVLSARDGEQALQVILDYSPALVVLTENWQPSTLNHGMILNGDKQTKRLSIFCILS